MNATYVLTADDIANESRAQDTSSARRPEDIEQRSASHFEWCQPVSTAVVMRSPSSGKRCGRHAAPAEIPRLDDNP
jgi:hypothetical protein